MKPTIYTRIYLWNDIINVDKNQRIWFVRINLHIISPSWRIGKCRFVHIGVSTVYVFYGRWCVRAVCCRPRVHRTIESIEPKGERGESKTYSTNTRNKRKRDAQCTQLLLRFRIVKRHSRFVLSILYRPHANKKSTKMQTKQWRAKKFE